MLILVRSHQELRGPEQPSGSTISVVQPRNAVVSPAGDIQFRSLARSAICMAMRRGLPTVRMIGDCLYLGSYVHKHCSNLMETSGDQWGQWFFI